MTRQLQGLEITSGSMEWFTSGFQRPTSTTPNRIRSSLPLAVGKHIHIHGSAFPSKTPNGKATLRRGSLHASMDLCTSNSLNTLLIARGVQCVLVQRPCGGWQGSPQREERRRWRSQSCDGGREEERERAQPLRAAWGTNEWRRGSQGEARGGEEEEEVRRAQSGWRRMGGRTERSYDGLGRRREGRAGSPSEVRRREEKGGLECGQWERRKVSGRSLSVDSTSVRGGSQRGMRKAELTLKERPLRSWGERQRGESPKHHDREGQENDSSHSNTGHRPEELRQGQENDPSHSNRGRRPEELREGPHVNQSRGGTRERPQSCMERRRG
ncbi:hypothetical protein AALO_G00069610, partial [Alosa alosa]